MRVTGNGLKKAGLVSKDCVEGIFDQGPLLFCMAFQLKCVAHSLQPHHPRAQTRPGPLSCSVRERQFTYPQLTQQPSLSEHTRPEALQSFHLTRSIDLRRMLHQMKLILFAHGE
eukprot:s118_g32.t1